MSEQTRTSQTARMRHTSDLAIVVNKVNPGRLNWRAAASSRGAQE